MWARLAPRHPEDADRPRGGRGRKVLARRVQQQRAALGRGVKREGLLHGAWDPGRAECGKDAGMCAQSQGRPNNLALACC